MGFNQPPGGNKMSSTPLEALSLQQRLAGRGPDAKIKIMKGNPAIGEMTQPELSSFDPESGKDGDLASTVLITTMMSDGMLTKERFIRELTEGEEGMFQRATATVENMLTAGLLEIKNGKIYTNMELVRG